MGKNNKNKNKQPKPAKTPVVKSNPSGILGTKEKKTSSEITPPKQLSASTDNSAVEKILRDANTKADLIIDDAKKEAEEIKQSIIDDAKKEAEEIKLEASDDINKRLMNAEAETKIKMRKDIEEAENKAKKITDDAHKEATILKTNLQKQIKEAEQKNSEATKKLADSITQEMNYKLEVENKFQNELFLIKSENEKLHIDNKKMIQELQFTKDNEELLKEQISALNEGLEEFREIRAKNLRYEINIKDLESKCKNLNDMCESKIQENNGLQDLLRLYGDDPKAIIDKNEQYKKRIEELETYQSNLPSESELDKLKAKSVKYYKLESQVEDLKIDILKKESELMDIAVNRDELETYRRFIKILELQKSELQKELDHTISLYRNKVNKIFANLSKIDETVPEKIKSSRMDLKTICENFRIFLSTRDENPLYYDEKIIRTFIAGFASSRLMILEGLSGTGKSSLPRAFEDFVQSKALYVPVQSSWKDRNDLLGFYNDFKKQYKETEFLKALYTASHDHNRIHCIVLDEMNISRIEYYFADLLSILENPNKEDWKIELISDSASISDDVEAWPKLIDDGKLQICDNTWFIGTANKDDSTFTITDKVYDRSVVINFESKGEKEQSNKKTKPKPMNNFDFLKSLEDAKTWKVDEKKKFDIMIKNLDDEVKKLFEITFGNRIANQLESFVPAYVSCGGTLEEAIDIMFSRKVLRKIEGLYDENTKTSLGKLRDFIKTKQYKLNISLEQIGKMERRI